MSSSGNTASNPATAERPSRPALPLRTFGRALVALTLGLTFAAPALPAETADGLPTVAEHALPPEARDVLARIKTGGPFPYSKDGSPFFNREGLLPQRPRGYYREYTVPTPGARHRGARRIVTGGQPPAVHYYTADHYRSFSRIHPQ